MDSYNLLLNFIVLVKVLYLIVVSIHFFYKFDIIKLSKENEDRTELMKEFIEEFYFFLMGIVILIKFRTNKKVKISHFEQHLFYLFGILLCIHIFELFLEGLRYEYKQFFKHHDLDDDVENTIEYVAPFSKSTLKILALLG